MKVVGYNSYAELLTNKDYVKEEIASSGKSLDFAKRRAVLDSSYVVVYNKGRVAYLYYGGKNGDNANGEIWTFIPDAMKSRVMTPIKKLAEYFSLSYGTVQITGICTKSMEIVILSEDEVEGSFLGEETMSEIGEIIHPMTSCLPLPVYSITFPAVIDRANVPLICYYKTGIYSEEIKMKDNACSVHFDYGFNLPWLTNVIK